MFSKSRINEPAARPPEAPRAPEAPMMQRPSLDLGASGAPMASQSMAPKAKPVS